LKTPDFEKAKRLAAELLAAQDSRLLEKIVLPVKDLCFNGKDIRFTTFDKYKAITGFDIAETVEGETESVLVRRGKTYVILVSDSVSGSRLNWDYAHELGHIYMGHTKDDRDSEVEANFFAAQLLMPEYSVYRLQQVLGRLEPLDLELVFGVNNAEARKRCNTFARKTSVNSGRTHLKIYEMQKGKIDKYADQIMHDELIIFNG